MMDDFEIGESDDEWSVYNPPAGNSSDPFIPNRLIPLFNEVKEKGVLNLSCVYPCKKVLKDTNPKPAQSAMVQTPPATITNKPKEVKKDGADVNKTFEAFDFDNDENNDKPSAKRKTPASVKRERKVASASMSNVMNDLLRSKLLDELEAAKKDDGSSDSL